MAAPVVLLLNLQVDQAAKEMGIVVCGVSFHVGSGATNPDAFSEAIALARAAFDAGAGVLPFPPFICLNRDVLLWCSNAWTSIFHSRRKYTALAVRYELFPLLPSVCRPGILLDTSRFLQQQQ